MTNILLKPAFLFTVLLSVVFAARAGVLWAGGIYIQEFGTPSMGVASAGAEAVCKDASTSFHNPAGMTRLEGNELMLVAGILDAGVEFESTDSPFAGGDGGRTGGYSPIFNAFYARSLSEDLKLGVNLISTAGYDFDYDDDWAGRYLCEDIRVFTITLNPSISYRVNDWLSVGGGVGVMFGELEMEVAVLPTNGDGKVKIDGNDVDVGYSFSALFEPSERLRLGVIYWSKIEPSFADDVSIQPGTAAGVDTRLTFPQFIRVGSYLEVNDKLALLGTIAWEDWSELKNLFVSNAMGTEKIPRNWDDTWHFAGGLHYRIRDQWLLQGGLAYDTSPVEKEERTPDMPADRQFRYSLGVQYERSEKVSTGLTFTYCERGDAHVRNPLLRGEYNRNDFFYLCLSVNWK
jgi:long-chain fatty acid transport protein